MHQISIKELCSSLSIQQISTMFTKRELMVIMEHIKNNNILIDSFNGQTKPEGLDNLQQLSYCK